MGLFDFLSRRKNEPQPGDQTPAEPSSLDALWINNADASLTSASDAMLADVSDAVWTELQDALRNQQYDRASALCETHEATIQSHFTQWSHVPEEIRGDSLKFDQYMRSLLAVAEAFQNAGIPDLMDSLRGDGNSNPLMAWDTDLRRAQKLLKEGSIEEAIELLLARLQQHAKHSGSGKDVLEPRTYGMLGIAYHLAGESPLAIENTTKALEISQRHNDQTGIATYQANLEQMIAASQQAE